MCDKKTTHIINIDFSPEKYLVVRRLLLFLFIFFVFVNVELRSNEVFVFKNQ